MKTITQKKLKQMESAVGILPHRDVSVKTALVSSDATLERGKTQAKDSRVPQPGNEKVRIKASIFQSLDINTRLRTILDKSLTYFYEVASGETKKTDWARIKVGEIVLDHVIGKPTQKLVLPLDSQGRSIIPYSQIIVMADKALINIESKRSQASVESISEGVYKEVIEEV